MLAVLSYFKSYRLFKSDSLIYAPDILFERLADLFKAFFTHADFPEEILACAFIPLLKEPLKDDTSSENYRAIAVSSSKSWNL